MSEFQNYSQTGSQTASYDMGLRAYMQKVFNYMGAGLALTGGAAMVTYSAAINYPAFGAALFGSPLRWVVMLAPLAMVMFLSFRLHKMSPATAQLTFWAYATIMGVSFATLGMVYTGASIARIFFITAATFAAVSVYGYTTKRDLTGMGSFLMMGLIGLIIASVVNIWMASSAMSFALSIIGVLVFTGLTAYDVQNIKRSYQFAGDEKSAIGGALSLYLNFINMFLSMLNLFGDRE